MKYNSNNKPLECMMTQSTCYRGTNQVVPKGVLWHSTGSNNTSLKRYVQPDDNAPNRAALLVKLGTNTSKNDWNHIEREAGVNAWIGKLADGTVTTVQTLPWNYRPWGCGKGSKGSCNYGWIQFEICEDALNDATYFNKVYQEACELTAYLCQLYNIDPNGKVTHEGVSVPTILCHADAHSLGLGSNHADVNHWLPKFGKSMATVRADVAALLKSANASSGGSTSTSGSSNSSTGSSGSTTSNTASSDKKEYVKGDVVDFVGTTHYSNSNAASGKACKAGVAEVIGVAKTAKHPYQLKYKAGGGSNVYGWVDANTIRGMHSETPANTAFQPYTVRVTASSLNIRKGAGTNYAVVGSIKDKGVYTIVGEESGVGATKWLKLKSGAGYIASDYTTKL